MKFSCKISHLIIGVQCYHKFKIVRIIILKMSSSSSFYIEFQNVHFYYAKSNPVLNGINMHINKGNSNNSD